MTEETLIKGQKIFKEIERLYIMKDDWNKSIKINQISLIKPRKYCPDEQPIVDESFINFEELKLSVVSKIEKRIKELKQEFSIL